jgi:pimeloyl-ACP methyl ester carboxylesterase
VLERIPSRRFFMGALLVALLTALYPGTAQAAALGSTVSSRTTTFNGDELTYYGNASLATSNTSVKTLLVVVHGNSRNADDYARYAIEAAQKQGTLGSTLVVAPWFKTESETTSSTRLHWGSDGWKSGDKSYSNSDLSSFDVTDKLLAQATKAKFPNLTRIAVIGHSAGGQFVNRYAAGSRATLPVPVRYIGANPSSYMYWTPQRNGRDLTSSEKSSCSGWNDYKYGLDARNSWMNAVTADALKARYKAADYVYLLGTADTDPNDADLDASCEGKWQGAHRFERGQRYFTHVTQVLAPAKHRLVEVPNVAHSGRSMITSSQGRAQIFGP